MIHCSNDYQTLTCLNFPACCNPKKKKNTFFTEVLYLWQCKAGIFQSNIHLCCNCIKKSIIFSFLIFYKQCIIYGLNGFKNGQHFLFIWMPIPIKISVKLNFILLIAKTDAKQIGFGTWRFKQGKHIKMCLINCKHVYSARRGLQYFDCLIV